jgi:hypothetical protein
MRIRPLYKLKSESPEFGNGRDSGLTSAIQTEGGIGRKAVVLCLDGLMLPPGTPKRSVFRGVEIIAFRGEINHFHDVDGCGWMVPAGWDPDGYVVAKSSRLGKGRRAIRAFLSEYVPVDECILRHRMRDLVRQGD